MDFFLFTTLERKEEYDENNQIIEVKYNNVTKYTTKYDLLGNVVENHNIDDNYKQYYIYSYDGTLQELADSNGNTIIYKENGKVINTFDKKYEINYNYKEEKLITEYTYDGYGQVISGDVSKNSLLYRSYYYDQETSYYYLNSRYYNPDNARFQIADEITYLGITGTINSYNLFGYCENNSVNNVDKDGHVVTPANIIGAAIGIVLGSVGGYFLSRYLADQLNLKGWKRTVFITGITAVITAAAGVIGYFIGPYVQKAGQVLITSIKRLYAKRIGSQVGRLGTIIKNNKPLIKGLTDHGGHRLFERGVTKTMAQTIVNNGIAISQPGGKVLYLTKIGVVVLNHLGYIVTTYGSSYFDDNMKAIVALLFK